MQMGEAKNKAQLLGWAFRFAVLIQAKGQTVYDCLFT
jgi:hypothetical protein